VRHPATLVAPADEMPLFAWKRFLDIVLGGLLLIVLSPLLALIALAIWVDTPGPALYLQDRVGRHAVPFRMLKFRTMHVNSDDASHRRAAAAWFAGQPTEHGYKDVRDPRVTRSGRLLRALSLDELPQLVNVVRGDMSLVGPRPGIAYELEHYADWHFKRLQVRPGITGLWQVMGRDRLPAEQMMRLDCRYVERCSLALDLKILALTIPTVLGMRRPQGARMDRAGLP
jgi:lipopolysaccharide/colanic/teichoic acid biosynthesis glycosyltransferase